MMIFKGDFVSLSVSRINANWLEVVDVLGPMHISLSNGQIAEATTKHIRGHRSANEMNIASDKVTLEGVE